MCWSLVAEIFAAVFGACLGREGGREGGVEFVIDHVLLTPGTWHISRPVDDAARGSVSLCKTSTRTHTQYFHSSQGAFIIASCKCWQEVRVHKYYWILRWTGLESSVTTTTSDWYWTTTTSDWYWTTAGIEPWTSQSIDSNCSATGDPSWYNGIPGRLDSGTSLQRISKSTDWTVEPRHKDLQITDRAVEPLYKGTKITSEISQTILQRSHS